MHALDKLKVSGRAELRNIARSGKMPESEIASAILGTTGRVLYRVSQVDDYITVTVNGDRVGPPIAFGHESGWVNASAHLRPGRPNELDFQIRNSPYEGCGGRFQVSAGTQQYDYWIYLKSCPPNRDDIWIGIVLAVDDGGKISSVSHDVHYLCPTDPNYCVKGCEGDARKTMRTVTTTTIEAQCNSRPTRLAFILDKPDPDQLKTVFARACTLWGGVFNPDSDSG